MFITVGLLLTQRQVMQTPRRHTKLLCSLQVSPHHRLLIIFIAVLNGCKPGNLFNNGYQVPR